VGTVWSDIAIGWFICGAKYMDGCLPLFIYHGYIILLYHRVCCLFVVGYVWFCFEVFYDVFSWW